MGHVFHLAWYMNGVGFGDSSRTSVPKIMASYPPPPRGFVLHIGIYRNVVQIEKRHTSHALAFNMQTWPNILPDLVLAC